MPLPGDPTRPESLEAFTGWLQRAVETHRPGDAPRTTDITRFGARERHTVDQLLGEGEVCLKLHSDEGPIRIQESVLPGIWRRQERDHQGRLRRDRVEVGELPQGVRRPPGPVTAEALRGDTAAPEGVTQARAILTELADHLARWKPGRPAHAINLTLLPLSPADLAFLERRLGRGPVETLSRGYGDCRVISTACAGIWWVRYTNAMGRLILDTLEVTDIPAVVCAAPEDLEDTRRRLPDLLEELADLTSPAALEGGPAA